MSGFFVSPYFSASELQCKGTGKLEIEPVFLERLIEFREVMGFPFKINSGCRSPEHNKRVGGSTGSMHMTINARFKKKDGSTLHTNAVDISKTKAVMANKEKFKWHAANLGFSIGGGRTFFHIDLARELAAGVDRPIFTYPNGRF